MIRDITIGQYYQGNSILHRLDPRLKIVAAFMYMIALFMFEGVAEYIFIILMVGVLIKISGIPFRYMIRGLRPILLILIFTASIKILFTPGTHSLYSKGIINISLEGIGETIFILTRITLLITGTSLVTYTTTPNRMTDGLESVLSPLKVFGVHVSDMAMMMSIAIRFIPILIEETDRIMKAQISRGADFEGGNVIRKIKNMMPLFIPLFVAAFRRAGDLALAMEARCYQGGAKRTKMKPLMMKMCDYIAIIVLLIMLVILTAFKIFL